MDRTHRIGQDKPVVVYRLVAKDTIEEKVMALKAEKAAVRGGHERDPSGGRRPRRRTRSASCSPDPAAASARFHPLIVTPDRPTLEA